MAPGSSSRTWRSSRPPKRWSSPRSPTGARSTTPSRHSSEGDADDALEARVNPGPLPEEIKRVRDEVVAYARAFGLDFFDTIFEMVDLEGMLEVASYGGFPNRYPHWRFGMDFEELDRTTTYGLSRIYELVLNTDPCYAYLLRSNSLTEQKLVIAHVLGHSDFF